MAMWSICDGCRGRGMVHCDVCYGEGCTECNEGEVDCPDCEGEGEICVDDRD